MIFEELLNAVHSITQIKISPDIKMIFQFLN